MARLLCHCVILVAVVTCGGVLLGHTSRDKEGNKVIHKPSQGSAESIYHSGDSQILLDLPYKRVSIDEFENHLQNSKTPADLFRIFFENRDLTDFQINEIMELKLGHIYSSSLERELQLVRDQEDDAEENSAAWEHFQEMQDSPLNTCHDPAPEIEKVENSHSDTIRHYIPRCTVVHRCRNVTGCCPDGYECSPKAIQVIQKPFYVFEETYERTGVKPSTKRLIEMKSFINHTECECRPIEKPVECTKRCPKHFTKRTSTTECHCDCRHNPRCRKIRHGLLPLDERDLECIKAEECMIPTCVKGKFRVQNGFCPRARRQRK